MKRKPLTLCKQFAAGVPLWCWLVILLTRCNLYCQFPRYVMSDDSASYIDFESSAFLRGSFSNGGAPMYSLILDMCDPAARLFGSDGLHLVVCLQILCSFTALFLLADLLRCLGLWGWIRCAAVLCYGLWPAAAEWDVTIMTESFSLSGCIAFFWCAVRLITAPRRRYVWLALAICAFLVFLRPQFLTYPVMLLVFFLLKGIWPGDQTRRSWLQAAALTVVFLLLTALYAARYKKEVGIFSLTDAIPRQNLVICIERQYYLASSDAAFVDAVQTEIDRARAEDLPPNTNEAWTAMWRVLNRYGYEQIDRLTKECIRNVGLRYWQDTAVRAMLDMNTKFGGYVYMHVMQPVFGLPGVLMTLQYSLFGWLTVGGAMLASFLEGAVMVWQWISTRKPPWVHMALFSITFTTVYLTFITTCGEYMRTMISVVPYLFILSALAVQSAGRYIQMGDFSDF